jgi:hypothetical protein
MIEANSRRGAIMMFTILVSVVVSLLSLSVCLKLGRSRGGFFSVLVLSIFGIFFSGLLIWPALALQMAFTFLASLVGLVFNPPRWYARGLMIAPVVMAYAIGIYQPVAKMYHLAELREKFPLESLAARLDYEHKDGSSENRVQTVSLAPHVEGQLNGFEQANSRSRRQRSLEILYDQSRQDFILATGFGPGRMRDVYPDVFVLEDAGPVSLADELASRKAIFSDASTDALLVPVELPTSSVLKSLHNEGLNDFLSADRMGYVKDLDHVAGFESHRFTRLPREMTDPSLRWAVVRMELIGLMKYDEPRAYVSEFLPRLDELGKAATREIDDFEQAALERLQTEEDLVIDEAPGRVRMLGSLRAGRQCLDCHSVERGQLLGALSYEIAPIVPSEQKPADLAHNPGSDESGL